jgi:hypothetical protein
MIFLRKLEVLSGRIHRVAMQVRGKPFSGNRQNLTYSVVVFLLKVEFLTVDAARKALASLVSRDSSFGLIEKARKVLASALPSFALDEEDVLVDLRSLHDAIGVMRHGTPSLHSESVKQVYTNEQRTPSSKRVLIGSYVISALTTKPQVIQLILQARAFSRVVRPQKSKKWPVLVAADLREVAIQAAVPLLPVPVPVRIVPRETEAI